MRSIVGLPKTRSGDDAGAMSGRIANFFIIGGMKCGTTSLYHYVRDHPQVFMPKYKALEFFAGGESWERGVDWYRKQFAAAPPDAIALGEASNVYAKYPRYTGVPERMARFVPDARLLYLVRDPIERIRSHYQHRASEGRETDPFDVAAVENPMYVAYSSYGLQIDRFLEYFDRGQLLVIRTEALRAERRATMQDVYRFLGVDPEWVSPDLDREFFLTTDRPSRSLVPPRARKVLKRYIPASKRAKELEANVLRRLRGARSRGEATAPAKPDVSPELRERLVALLADDVRKLRAHLGPAFDGWGIA